MGENKLKKTLCCCILIIILLTGCVQQNEKSKEQIKSQPVQAKGFITKDEALDLISEQPEILDIDSEDSHWEIVEIEEPGEEDPLWKISLQNKLNHINYKYYVDAYTKEIVEIEGLEHNHGEDVSKEEMIENLSWVFENWQSFHYESYDPTKYGLAFTLNFRLLYIFDNYDENVEKVTAQKIESEVKVVEIKDSAMVFSEEDHTMYAQIRFIADYKQIINGQSYSEPVEAMVFAKYHLDSEEGWQITNVDMTPTEESKNFDKLFFGFKKPR